MADWRQAAKREYITTDTSYRKLAKKYGISVTQICNVGREEGWVEQREQYLNRTTAKTIEKISAHEADRAARIYSVADKLLRKIEAMVDSEEVISEKGIRSLTAAVKDLKEIQGVRSDIDRQEQEARIANLRRQAEKNDAGNNDGLTVILEGVDEYAG